jgi:hypothetical protein
VDNSSSSFTNASDQLPGQNTFVRALYDYQSSDPVCLSFCKDDLIEVFVRQEGGWWDGRLGNKRGWFPSSYVTAVSDGDTPLSSVFSTAQPSKQSLVINMEPSDVVGDNASTTCESDYTPSEISVKSAKGSFEEVLLAVIKEVKTDGASSNLGVHLIHLSITKKGKGVLQLEGEDARCVLEVIQQVSSGLS